MAVLRRFAVVCVTTTLALVAVACGGTSPTSPFGFPGGTTGVVIDGEVSGASQGVTALATTSATLPGTFATSGTTPVTVSIVGTNISQTVDGSGHFHLRDVPVGDVQVKFTADGLDATITLKDIEAGDQIHIKVKITDRGVRLEAFQRDRKGDDDLEFKGDVSGLGGTCPNLTFTLNGTIVKTSSATRYEHGSCGTVANGVRVEVHGHRDSGGAIQAAKIEFDDD